MKEDKKEKVITGMDVAYWCSIISLIACFLYIIFEFINKIYDFKKIFVLILLCVGFFYYVSNNRKDKKNR